MKPTLGSWIPSTATRRLLTGLSGLLVALVGMSGMPAAKAAEYYNAPPSNCVAPFLDQAFRMRWHESYLMNPADSIPTWVICPIETSPQNLTDSNYYAFVQGAKMDGASSDSPRCFLAITDRQNLSQPPYLDVVGAKRKYIVALNTALSGTIWSASPFSSITASQVSTDIGGSTSPYTQVVTLFCALPPGYSISQVQFANF
jgi:hypothetical protein